MVNDLEKASEIGLNTYRVSDFKNTLNAVITALDGDSITMRISKEGIRIRDMDASHVMMVDAFLPTPILGMVHLTNPVEFSLDTERVLKFLNIMTGGEENIGMIYEKGKLTLTAFLKNKTGRTITKTITLATREADEEPPTPKLAPKTCVRIPLKTLKKSFELAYVSSDNVKLTVEAPVEEGGKLCKQVFSVKGTGDLSETEVRLTPTEIKTIKETTTATYTLSYLLQIVKALLPFTSDKRYNGEVSLDFDDNYPVKITAPLLEGEKQEYIPVVQVYLAPRIEAE